MKNRRNYFGFAACVLVCGFLFMACTTKPATVYPNLEKKSLGEYAYVLEENINGVLANRNGEKMRTQIITFSFVEGNRAYFCTTSDKPLYEQLVAFPYVSYCTFPDDFEPVLSINGKVIFIEDRALKERALEGNYYAKKNFKTVDNPQLRVFCIDVETIETFAYTGAEIYTTK